MINDDTYRSFLSAFQMFSDPAQLIDSPLCDGCLVRDRIDEWTDLLPHQALKQVFGETLVLLESEQPESADLLRGRFWEGLQIEEMVGMERPHPMGKRSFSNHQREAICAFAFLFQQREARCQEKQEADLNLIEEDQTKTHFRPALVAIFVLFLFGASWMWRQSSQGTLAEGNRTVTMVDSAEIKSTEIDSVDNEVTPIIEQTIEQNVVLLKEGQNVVENGGFSEGTTYWYFNYLDERVWDGQLCNLVVSSGEPWELSFGQSDIIIESGETYRIAFEAKAEHSGQLFVRVGGMNPPHTTFTYTPFDLTPTMKQYGLDFTAISSDSTLLEFHLGGNKDDICVDNVSLNYLSSK